MVNNSVGHVYASLQKQHLCKTCYAFISVPFSPIGSSSVVDQHMEAVALLKVCAYKIVDACWLCKVKRAWNDDMSSRNLLPEARHKGRNEVVPERRHAAFMKKDAAVAASTSPDFLRDLTSSVSVSTT